MTVTINGTTGIAGTNGSAGTPAVQGEDTNTGVFFPAADTVAVATGGSERIRITSAGDVGIGKDSPDSKVDIQVDNSSVYSSTADVDNATTLRVTNVSATEGSYSGIKLLSKNAAGAVGHWSIASVSTSTNYDNHLIFNQRTSLTTYEERARIDSSGNLLVGTTTASAILTTSVNAAADGTFFEQRNGSGNGTAGTFNRSGSDGVLIGLKQAGTQEGTISVSGTTVSYNGGHLSRWSQLPNNSRDDSIVKGTVMTNLDEMCEWEGEDNEQLNKMSVSHTEGDSNVAGVFVNWDEDDDMNIAMTGDMVIRIAGGTTVQRGDLLMSAGDGTAKPQGDDIVRSKTIAKVTSTHVSHTYADGSYAVPCVLMAC